jgi:hypothetical protein
VKIKAKVDINPVQILESRGLGPSHAAQYYLASEIKRFCDPYVPFAQGALKNNAAIAQDGSTLTYPGPYAHYQYEGRAMGPNIPLIQGGQLVGFFSRGPKRYTGKTLQYHGAPMRGPKWDKRMLADKREELTQSVAQYVGGKPK